MQCPWYWLHKKQSSGWGEVEGMSAISSMVPRPKKTVKAKSTEYPMSLLLIFPPFEFPLPFLFSFFLETNQNPHHQVSSMLIDKCPTDRERFEPLSDRPGRPQTSLGLGGLTWVCCCFITPGAAVAFVGSSVLRVVFHSSFLSS